MNKPPPLAMMDTSFMKIMMAKMENPKTLDIYTHHEPSNDGSVVDKKKNDQSLERSLDAPPPREALPPADLRQRVVFSGALIFQAPQT